jgi:hypothetical protein
MPFTETTKITLEAGQAFELHRGIVMPPGSYSGTKTRTRVSYLDASVNWTPTRYRIELTAEQLASIGATVQPRRNRRDKIRPPRTVDNPLCARPKKRQDLGQIAPNRLPLTN